MIGLRAQVVPLVLQLLRGSSIRQFDVFEPAPATFAAPGEDRSYRDDAVRAAVVAVTSRGPVGEVAALSDTVECGAAGLSAIATHQDVSDMNTMASQFSRAAGYSWGSSRSVLPSGNSRASVLFARLLDEVRERSRDRHALYFSDLRLAVGRLLLPRARQQVNAALRDLHAVSGAQDARYVIDHIRALHRVLCGPRLAVLLPTSW